MYLFQQICVHISESSTSHLADVVGSFVTAHVIPLVVSRNWEEGVMLLPESETHLVVLIVVRLTVPPIKPLDGCVHVIPLPFSRLVLTVPTRSTSTKPECSVFTRRNCRKETSLQPVVDPWVIKLSNPGSRVSGTHEVSFDPPLFPSHQGSCRCPELQQGRGRPQRGGRESSRGRSNKRIPM